MLVQPKNKFKAMDAKVESAFVIPKPQPILSPKPEDIPALVKSDVQMAFQVQCSPEVGKACLALNKNNYRAIGKAWSDQILSDMVAEPTRFKQAGDAIRFDCGGALLDGQHRLDALVRSGKTFILWFIAGLPEEAREVIDFGRPRKVSHLLRNMGYENYFLLSAAASWLIRIRKGQSAPSGLLRPKDGAGTVEEVLQVVKGHPDLVKSCLKGRQGRTISVVPGSLVAAVHYIGGVCLKEAALADSFVKDLKPNNSHNQKSAAFVWRLELEGMRDRGLSASPEFKARGTIEAWNLFMMGASVERIDIPERCTFKNLDYKLL